MSQQLYDLRGRPVSRDDARRNATVMLSVAAVTSFGMLSLDGWTAHDPLGFTSVMLGVGAGVWVSYPKPRPQ